MSLYVSSIFYFVLNFFIKGRYSNCNVAFIVRRACVRFYIPLNHDHHHDIDTIGKFNQPNEGYTLLLLSSFKLRT